MKKRIIILDEHPLMRRGIQSILDTDDGLEIIAEGQSRREGFTLIQKHSPHILITDLILGSDDGLHFIKECRSLFESLLIIVISVGRESTYAERVIRAGAHGFVSKTAAESDLLEAIQTVLSGNLYLSRASTSRILDRVISKKDEPEKCPIESLSDRELHVFRLIGKGLSTREIAANMNLSRKTIESFKEKIKLKLKLANATELRQEAANWRDGPGYFEVGL